MIIVLETLIQPTLVARLICNDQPKNNTLQKSRARLKMFNN